MLLEIVAAIGAGVLAGSLALIAFGGDSIVEFLSGLVVLQYLRTGMTEPLRKSRPVEIISVTLLAALIPVIGLATVYSYTTGLRPESSPLGIIIATGAVIIMPYLWYEKQKIGRDTSTLPLSIDAAESITCLFMAISLLGGLLAETLLGFWWADYIATIFILVFVAGEVIESLREINE